MSIKVLLPPECQTDPFSIFSLFFTPAILTQLAENTNANARVKLARLNYQTQSDTVLRRRWKDTSGAELKIFFGLLIFMGINRSPSPCDHWRYGRKAYFGIYHYAKKMRRYQDRRDRFFRRYSIKSFKKKHMGVVRFEQLKRYFHVSDPNTPTVEWWHKLEPLSSSLQDSFLRYYIPSSKVVIDEMMVPFCRRSSHTVKAPHKPAKKGYKIFARSQFGYTSDWLYYSPTKGIAKLHKQENLTPTSSAVYQLATSLPYQSMRFEIILDNYFTNVPLFEALLDIGIGAAGTT